MRPSLAEIEGLLHAQCSPQALEAHDGRPLVDVVREVLGDELARTAAHQLRTVQRADRKRWRRRMRNRGQR